jgi:pyruvate,orthophosphate dikinase
MNEQLRDDPVAGAIAADFSTIGYGVQSAPDPARFGFKGANLLRMAALGLRVPQAFVIGTGACRAYFAEGSRMPRSLRDAVAPQMRALELATGLTFGSARRPLLVSVRSGAATSMPGMMETVLNVGLNETSVRGLLRYTGNPRLAWDSFRRLVQSFAETVHGCASTPFDDLVLRELDRENLSHPRELDFASLERLTRESLATFEALTGRAFPQGPAEQLEAAVGAVFASWHGAKACEYRRLNGIADDPGTAVTIQRMVYGNAGGTSGAGVSFTRDPATGEPRVYTDFLFNAQGEDVVSGRCSADSAQMLGTVLPEIDAEIAHVAALLEREFRDAQEFEFTVQDGKLYLLQTRTAKRTPFAAVRMAIDQVAQGLLSPDEALARLEHVDLERVETTRIVADASEAPLAKGIPASLGVATGAIALDSAMAERMQAEGRRSVLVRDTVATDDIAGIAAAAAIVTGAGGRTSHAAVVARQLGKVCVVGCESLTVDLAKRRCAFGGAGFAEGDVISVAGDTGDIYAGPVRVVTEKPATWLAEIRSWRNARANAAPG